MTQRMPHRRAALLTASSILSVLSAPALAYEVIGAGQTYVAVQGGIAKPEKHDFLTSAGAKVTTEMKDGYVVVGAVGRKSGNVRMELEGSFRKSDVENHVTTGAPLAGSRGKAKVMAGMANAYFDIPTTSSVQPYIGGGVGVANVDYSDYATTSTGVVMDDDNSAFAYQGMAGVAMPLNGRLSLNAEYRYFATADVEVQNGTRKSDTEYKTHNFVVGARYAF